MNGTDYPGFYFEIGQYGFSYGCGFYQASTAFLNAMRGLILADAPEFLAAEKAYRSQSVYQMDGECYKRPHFPDYPREKREWLERRGVSFNAESRDFALLFSEKLSEKLAADFRLLAPVYRFLAGTAERVLRDDTAGQLLQR